jgi:hypothetical protein
MDSDDNADIGADIGPPRDDAQGETGEQAVERRSAEDEDLRESLVGLCAAAASGFGTFAEPVHADTIGGRIRFLGARVWISPRPYSRICKISRPASVKMIRIWTIRWRR